MPFQIIRQDITRMDVDAIVNPTNECLVAEGGTDAQIHRAAGPEMDRATAAIRHIDIGTAVITDGFALPCRYVIHTAGPVWQDGSSGETGTLRACYEACLKLAAEKQLQSLAFPLLSAGTYGFPREIALRIGTDTIRDFLFEHEMDVFLVVYDTDSYTISKKLYANIRFFLSSAEIARPARAAQAAERPVSPAPYPTEARRPPRRNFRTRREEDALFEEAHALKAPVIRPAAPAALSEDRAASPFDEDVPHRSSIEEYMKLMEEGFREMLIRKIDESGMTDVQCYKRANVDRKLFNKIKNQPDYHPGKPTVIALALALELSEAETQELLRKAGYTLSRSSRFDLIIRYFITHGQYDVFEINETLFAFGQSTLGSSIA